MLYDYDCSEGHRFEIRSSIADKPSAPVCPECGALAKFVFTKAPVLFTTIIPSYPGALKQKAGYVHSHGDKPATKTMSGPYGMVQKGETADWTKNVILNSESPYNKS